jgi:putative colanic acid biosynthesis acetyltransferase WcaF
MNPKPSSSSFASVTDQEMAGRITRGRKDPYTAPQYSFGNRVKRQLWSVVWIVLYRPSPRIVHAWRAGLLRCFGAKLGAHCRFYPASRVWAPWNLQCEDTVMVADGAELYNPAPMFLASHAIVSQGAYLCGATHDYNDPKFPVVAFPMRVGRYAWVAARAWSEPRRWGDSWPRFGGDQRSGVVVDLCRSSGPQGERA